MYKVFSTFTWAAGFEVWLERALGEIEIVGFSEIDKYAIQLLKKHFPLVKNYGDITKIDIRSLPDFDILVGGFPCQDVSIAWKQDLEKGRTILVLYLLKILEIKRPMYFKFENVKGILSKKFRPFYRSILDRIVELGYDVDASVYNTKDYGIPHNRQRVFFCWSRDGDMIFFRKPQPIKLVNKLSDLLEENVEERFYLSKEIEDRLFYMGCRKVDRGGVKIVNSTSIGYTIAYPWDGIDLSYTNSTTRRGRVQRGVSTTLLCGEAHGVLTEDYRIRRLTPVERERLQGYPDNWTAGLSEVQRFNRMGNSISTVIPEFIARNLILKENI